MKALFFCLFFLPLCSVAQKHTPLPHGMVFGQRFETINPQEASGLDAFMGRQTRTSTIIIGTVLKVTKPKGGWFEIDAGNGKVITAHFKDYNITLPPDLKGRQVLVSGVAARQFLSANSAHLEGRNSGSMHNARSNTGNQIDFEVTGLYVNK